MNDYYKMIWIDGVSSSSWVQYSAIHTPKNGDTQFYLKKETVTAGTMLFDEVTLKRITDPPSTGVHIVSAYGGSTRAWTNIDSGFDPNNIVTITIIGGGAKINGNINVTGVYKVDDVQVVKEQQAHIADLNAAYAAGDLDIEAEIITAINATNAKINAILAMLEAHGLVAGL